MSGGERGNAEAHTCAFTPVFLVTNEGEGEGEGVGVGGGEGVG